MATASKAVYGGLAELSQQPLRFLLRQPSPNHRLRHLPLGLAVKLVAFGECAFIQPVKAGTHTSMNERWCGLDNNLDLAITVVTEPIEGHGQPFGR
jgi:hypothetical protein